jgi:hypothetical protein
MRKLQMVSTCHIPTSIAHSNKLPKRNSDRAQNDNIVTRRTSKSSQMHSSKRITATPNQFPFWTQAQPNHIYQRISVIWFSIVTSRSCAFNDVATVDPTMHFMLALFINLLWSCSWMKVHAHRVVIKHTYSRHDCMKIPSNGFTTFACTAWDPRSSTTAATLRRSESKLPPQRARWPTRHPGRGSLSTHHNQRRYTLETATSQCQRKYREGFGGGQRVNCNNY